MPTLPTANLSDPVAKIVQELIVAQSLGTLPSSNGSWPVYAENFANTPDDCIVIQTTTPILQGRYMASGAYKENPAFQITVRSNDLATGDAKAREISVDLTENFLNQVFSAASGQDYRIHALSKASGPLFLGKDTESASGGDRFHRAESKRYLWSINFTMSIIEVAVETEILTIDIAPGSFEYSEYATSIAGIITENGAGRKIGDNSAYAEEDLRVRHQLPYELPVVNGTQLDCILYADNSDSHTQYVPYNATHESWGPAPVMKAYTKHKHVLIFEMSNDDWSGFTWVTILDMLPISWEAGWASSQEAPISFYYRGGDSVWRLSVRGAAEGQTTWDQESHLDVPIVGSPAGEHTLILEHRLDPSGATSYTEGTIDGTYFGKVTHANTVKNSADSTYAPGLYMKIGAYTSHTAPPRAGQIVTIKDHKTYNITT